jgi:glutathione synthase/RimK-type ligase-like ATP-grasp enzyme
MLKQLQCLTTACEAIGLPYSFFDDNHNCVAISVADKTLYFVNTATSFNRESESRIAEDKHFTYRLCRKDVLMPKTVGYVDPFVAEEYREYVRLASYAEITQDILANNELPVIVKRNRGSKGSNVFLCRSVAEISKAVRVIFNHRSKNYDYVALAQEYIPIRHEYRAITFQGKVILLYEKDTSSATFTGNLSPLHWKHAKAIQITNPKIIEDIQSFLSPFFTKLPLTFAGMDIAIDETQNIYLIEANTRPGFDYFIQEYGSATIVGMYETILTTYINSAQKDS